MYRRDLTPVGRDDRLRDAFALEPATPILHVGWLGTWRPHPRGATPAAFLERLSQLCAAPSLRYRGIFWCRQGLCTLRRQSACGAGEIVVVGKAHVFLAPSLVAHYVQHHDYRPPEAFIDAVLSASGPRRPVGEDVV